MRRTPAGPFALAFVLALALASTASASPLLTMRDDGSVVTREDRYLPTDAFGGERAQAGALRAPGSRGQAGALRAPRSHDQARALRAPGSHDQAGAQRAPRSHDQAGAQRAPRSHDQARAQRAPRSHDQARAASADAPRRSVRAELARMLAEGALDGEAEGAYRRVYAGALKTRKKLRGARRAALGATIETLEDVAAQGALNASRAPALFETVARNRDWWSRGPLLRYGARVSFQGSRLVWQNYTGQGLQIQWLGTFGKANALWQSRTHDDDLRALLDEALGLAAQRAGGIAFEYLFRFDRGRPPWVSGLAQGTAVQALSRAAVRLNEPRFFQSARAGLGIFREAPPSGVRVATPAGAHYLIYSFAPGLRVLNGYTQSLNGLHDFALLANDAEGRALFEAGERQLRAELPAYDTGAWSRYSNRRESDLGYHKLSRDFLRNLCTRLTEDRDRTAATAAQTALPQLPVASPPTGGTPPVDPPPTGGTPPAAPPPEAPAPLADPAPYCDSAQRFTGYLSQAPALKLATRQVRAGRPAALKLTLSKPAFVTLYVKRDGAVVASMSGRFGSGVRTLRWARPRATGDYTVALKATDLAGNNGSADGELRVLKARKRR